MSTDRLLQALGDVDAVAIEEAHPVHDRPPHRLRPFMAIAAAVAVVAAAVAVAVWPQGKTPQTDGQWPVKYVEVTKSSAEIAIVPKWDERTQPERFSELNAGDIRYTTGGNITLPPELVGAPLGSTTLQGYDFYTDTTHDTTVVYYAIVGIDPTCAVAVQFEGERAWYPYSNHWYMPDTLAQFISDLNLREHLTTASVWYRPDGRTVEFVGLQTETVWDLLLSDGTPTNIDIKRPDNVMSVSVSLPLLGIENVSLAVTADGYLTTNLLGTRKSFYIGEETTAAFAAYVLEHCEGTEIIYVDPDVDTPVPESSPESTVTMYSSAYTAP